MTDLPKKDLYDKIHALSIPILAILVPAAIASAGQSIEKAAKERDTQLKFVEIATSIIREDPIKANQPLREWAVDVLTKHSTSVPLSEAAQLELKSRVVKIGITSFGSGSTGSFSSYSNQPKH